jgi:anti-anti-sigma factor
MELAEVEVVAHQVAPVVRIRGEVDLSNVAGVRTSVIEALSHTAPGLVLDLTETTYLDSSGIRLVFDLARASRPRAHQVGRRGAAPSHRRRGDRRSHLLLKRGASASIVRFLTAPTWGTVRS